MSIYVFLSLFTAIFGLTLGNYVLYLDKNSRLNRYFFALSLFLAYWCFGSFIVTQVSTAREAREWWRLGSLWPFMVPAIFAIIAILTDYEALIKKWWLNAFLYIPACLIAYFEITTDYFCKVVEIAPGAGYTYQWDTSVLIVIVTYLWPIGIVSLLCYMVISRFLKCTDTNKRGQFGMLMAGMTSLFILGFVEMTAAYFHIKTMPTTDIGIFLFFTAIAYSVVKYNLFTIDPRMAADKILSAMNEGMLLSYPDGRIAAVNPSMEKISGFAGINLKEMRFDNLLAVHGGWENVFSLALSGGLMNREYDLINSQGAAIPVLVSCSVIRDNTGEPACLVCIIHELGELKTLANERAAMESKLLASAQSASLGLLAGGISHEMNNPLTVIGGYAQSLAKLLPESKSLLEDMTELVFKMRDRINTITAFTRTENSMEAPLIPAQILLDTFYIISQYFEERKVRIHLSSGKELRRILANPVFLKQLLLNVLLYAAEHIKAGNTLSVEINNLSASTIALSLSAHIDRQPEPEVMELYRGLAGANNGSIETYTEPSGKFVFKIILLSTE